MHRFYLEHADLSQKTVVLNDRHEVHHLKDVLRLKVGDKVSVFNGRNEQADAVIATVKADQIVLAINAVKKVDAAAVKIILACAVPKKAKFEFIIEKCTELGVAEIIPLKTKRTEVVFSAEKSPAKKERFQKVAVNAAKQTGRADVPKIHPMLTLAQALALKGEGTLALFPSLNGQPEHIREALAGKTPKELMIFIGPEGDFTPDEVNQAQEAGCVAVSLGKTVLKVDTAAIAAVALARFTCLD